MQLFGHMPEVVIKNELPEPVCLTWRLEQKVGASLGPLNEAKITSKSLFKVPMAKGCPVVLVSLARWLDGDKVLVFQINNACVKGEIVILTEGSAEFGLEVPYKDFLSQ